MRRKERMEVNYIILGFLGTEKAYDMVDREILGKVFGNIGLGAKITNIVP